MLDRVLYSALFNGDYPFKDTFREVTTVMEPTQIEDTNSVLIIWGGGDISPTIYNHPVLKCTGAREELSSRDKYELALAKRAIELGIPVIGVCRGAQMMCALAGGFLIQDVSGHTSGHDMKIVASNSLVRTSSLHHQMMYPFDVEHELLAVASPTLSKKYVAAIEVLMPSEPEVVWFPQVKALCIQGHPEFERDDSPLVQYCKELINAYCSR